MDLDPSRVDAEKERSCSAGFRTTRWSEVLAAGDASTPRGAEALAELCQVYWYPLYAYVRSWGCTAADAEDVTQAFFARLVEKEVLRSAEQGRGRFRWFLLASIQNFLRNEVARSRTLKRGGGSTLVSWDGLDAERRFQAEPRDAETPDRIFDLNWARAAMARAFERLGTEFADAGRSALFEQLKQYLGGAGERGGYRAIADRLGLSPVAVKVSVHRLRQRYRDYLRDEVAQTVISPEDVDDELRHLVALVAQ